MGHLNLREYLQSRSTTVEAGPGYRLVALPRRDAKVLLLNRGVLAQELRQAAPFVRGNMGALPDTPYWNLVVGTYRENPQLFALTHQCEPLLGFLRANERHHRLFPKTDPPPAVEGEILGPPTPEGPLDPPNLGEIFDPPSPGGPLDPPFPGGTSDPPPDPSQPPVVPEPPGGLLFALGSVR